MKRNIRFALLAFVLLAGVCFSSCSKEDEPATYTLKWKTSTLYIDDLTFFEYDSDGDVIANQRIGTPYEKKFTANKKAKKVKVYFELNGSPRWVKQVYLLSPGENTDIVIEDNTMIARQEP